MSPARARKFTPQRSPDWPGRASRGCPSVAERVLPSGLRVVAVRRASVPLVQVRVRIPSAVRRERRPGPRHADGAHHDARARRTARRVSWPRRCSASAGPAASTRAPTVFPCRGEALRSGFGDLLGLLAEVLTDAAYPKAAVEREAGRLGDQLRRALSQPGVVSRRGLAAAPVRRASLRPRVPHAGRGRRRGAGLAAGAAPAPGGARRQPARARGRPDAGPSSRPGGASPLRLDAPGHGAAVPKVPDAAPVPLLLVDRPGAVQSNLRVGGAAPRRSDAAYAAGQLANAIFGGYFSSRLTTNIREDKGYTYSPHSGIRHSRAAPGCWCRRRWDRRDGAGPGRGALRAWPDRLPPPDGRGAGRPRRSTSPAPSRWHRHPVGTRRDTRDLLSDGLGVEWLREHPARLAAVTPDEVQQAASTMLAPAAMVSVVVGDADVVGETLRRRSRRWPGVDA